MVIKIQSHKFWGSTHHYSVLKLCYHTRIVLFSLLGRGRFNFKMCTILYLLKKQFLMSDAAKPKNSEDVSANSSHKSSLSAKKCDPKHKDCLLREFRKLCAMVAEKPSYNVKTQIIQDFLKKGSGGGMIPAWHSQRVKALSKSTSKYYFKSKGETKSHCCVV